MLGASAATPSSSGALSKKLSPIHSRKIRIVIADDTQMGCNLLKSAIARSRFRFEVVACATSRSEVVHSLTAHPVDVALVSGDLLDGPLAGFQSVGEIRTSFPKISCVLLLESPTDDMVVSAFRSGAKGVFCREEPLPALWKCIRSVYEGQVWANSKQLHLLLEALVHAPPTHSDSFQNRPLLTKREDDVVNLVAAGFTNKAIAKSLTISEHTVSNYLFRIYEKLGISNRVELVLYTLSRRQSESPRS